MPGLVWGAAQGSEAGSASLLLSGAVPVRRRPSTSVVRPAPGLAAGLIIAGVITFALLDHASAVRGAVGDVHSPRCRSAREAAELFDGHMEFDGPAPWGLQCPDKFGVPGWSGWIDRSSAVPWPGW